MELSIDVVYFDQRTHAYTAFAWSKTIKNIQFKAYIHHTLQTGCTSVTLTAHSSPLVWAYLAAMHNPSVTSGTTPSLFVLRNL